MKMLPATNKYDRAVILTGFIAAAIVIIALLTGCKAPQPAGRFVTSTVFGVDITAWDNQSQSPTVKFGIIRNEYITVDSNTVSQTEFSKATDYEDEGWFKGNRVHTSWSMGKTSVTQPSQSQQMPSLRGSNTVWQPSIVPK